MTNERGDYMSTVPTQIRIDANVKKQANELFNELGNGYVQINIFFEAVYPERRTSIYCRGSGIHPRQWWMPWMSTRRISQ